MTRILFVCTGNTCRSPMAEAMLRTMARQKGISLEVRSAGVSTIDGLPISTHAATTLRGKNVEHRASSRALSGEAVAWADLILTMTAAHKRGLLNGFPEAVDKAYTLKEFVNQDTAVQADIEELERLYTEMHMKQVLGQQLTTAERTRLLELERRIPSFDIADPFGGTLGMYESCAKEIEESLNSLLNMLQKR
ncbi:low molecular weight protein arginine phosphatase [Paenibacillus glycanilyticus]|uniref:low molecular weight protein arginine phosphatase n=1 Tax=Paenibacillus glycanilyticus TaxID=126569 RepID=UPI00203DD255|nr:low molecular weight protein arginine phosphatase [Paenibacillus glycanilyticus]MCM3628034.1 low molecular weight protein arginine phosphatase [Paenibacillus glycanilyticus]